MKDTERFSPDGDRIAFIGKRGNQHFVVVDGVEHGPYDSTLKGSPAFSPNGRRVAYAVADSGKWKVVVDGKAGREYDSLIGSLVFSPDSKRIAHAAKRGNKWMVVVDTEEGKGFEGIQSIGPIFSPDSKRIAYGAGNTREQFVVVDGVPGQSLKGVDARSMVFSADSKRFAYAAVTHGNRFIVVVDGKASDEFDVVVASIDGTSFFSPDGRHHAFIAGRNKSMNIYVNGIKGPPVGDLLNGANLVFDGPTALHTVYRQNREFFRIEIELGAKAREN